MKMKMTFRLIFCLLCLFLIQCGGSSSSPQSLEDILAGLPSFSPSGSESLDSYVINTFTDSGINITVDPTKLDFNDEFGNISIDETKQMSFILSNNSSSTRTFDFNTYAVSSGFAILDEFKNNLGSWDEIVLAAGESQTFYIQFKASYYGTQTSYLVITADIAGNINFPFRAKVSGGGSALRVVSTAYSCSDDSAPELSVLDFYKIPTGSEYTQGFKVCNIGGQDIQIYSTQITNGDKTESSNYFSIDGFGGFDIYTLAEVSADFGLDFEPNFTESFIDPTELTPPSEIADASEYYNIVEYTSQTKIDNIVIGASDYTRFDVTFKPDLQIEAAEGSRYSALPANAVLTLESSLGPIEFDLRAATSGYEPQLTLQYRFADDATFQSVDMLSNVAAIDFGQIEVFLDSIPNNGKVLELLVGNSGTATYPLKFFPTDLLGYFEYYIDDAETLSFPLEIQSQDSQSFKIRYLPTPSAKTEETHWDVGQLKFEHTGANGPAGQVSFVADQSYGYAIEVSLNGSEVKHEYAENEAKGLCSVQIDGYGNPATTKAFLITNNDPSNTLHVTWSFNATEGSFTATSTTPSSFTVEPASNTTLSLDFLAGSAEVDGATLAGTLTLNTELTTPEGESLDTLYSDVLADAESHDFAINLSAQASSTGTCDLAPDIFADPDGDGIVLVNLLRDRTGMVMTDLTESNRDLPSNISIIPLELNFNNMTVRVLSTPLPSDFAAVPDERTIFRAYSHFFTNSKGCATLPTIPYGTPDGLYGFLEPKGLSCGTVTSNDGEFSVSMGQLNLPDPGPSEYTDENGKLWRKHQHSLGKVNLDTCQVEYYGKITNLAYNPNDEKLSEFLERMQEYPFENEAYYENYLGAYKHDSFIKIETNNFQCGSKVYNAGETITDPDELKECYLYLSTLDDSTRVNGRFDQASYFYFDIKEGDKTCDLSDTSSCHGIGPLEKHVTPDGKVLDNYYDLTLLNAELNAYVLTAGDRTSFLRHESHNIFAQLYVDFTTKPLASESDADGDYKQLIADNSKEHVDKNQIFLKDGERYDIKKFWTDDGFLSEISTIPNPEDLTESGVDYGGYGKGVFRKCENPDICDIIPAGWPLSLETTHMAWNGIGIFNKTGNILPGFAKASGAKGKPIYFYMEGCLVPGDSEVDPTRGCYSYKRDDAVMSDGTTLVIDKYKDKGMLPSGYPADAAECATYLDTAITDPTDPDFDPYKYITCINFQIKDIDRDRYTNYYDKGDPFVYEDNYYGASNCGYGM